MTTKPSPRGGVAITTKAFVATIKDFEEFQKLFDETLEYVGANVTLHIYQIDDDFIHFMFVRKDSQA